MIDKRRKKDELITELRQLRSRIAASEQQSVERQRTGGSLRESEQVLYSVISGSPIPTFVIGRDHQLIYWNRALEELSRIPSAEVIGTKQHWRAFYASERPCLADLLVDEILEKIPHWYSHKYVRSKLLEEAYEAVDFFPELGDQGKWLRFTAAVIRNLHGQLIGAIETLEDITERKQAEQQLLQAQEKLESRVKERTLALAKANESLQSELLERQRAEQALKQTSDHLALILESLPMVSYTRNAGGACPITFVSSTIGEMAGYTSGQFINDPSFWEDRIHPDDKSRVLGLLKTGIMRGYQRYEYRFRVADGSYKWFSDYWRVTPFSGASDRHIVGAWQDVSEEKRVRQEADLKLQQMMHTHKLTALGEVVAGVAHEINNPVSFISYNIPLLEEMWTSIAPALTDKVMVYPQWKAKGLTLDELDRNMREIIHAFKIAASRIARVINNLKNFAKSDDTSIQTRVSIDEVIQGALMIVGAQIRRTVSTITQHIEQSLPAVQGHSQKLEQVLANLLINAHQAILPGHKGRITITARYIDRIKSILVEIEDNGRGMPREVLDHAFDPFFTTRRDSGGTGLGLSISYSLIQEHHGTFAVISKPGIGSKFTVLLPVEEQMPVKLSSSMLLVDQDQSFLQEMKAHFVDAKPWPAISSDSPDSIVTYLEQHPEADVVIAEMNLPGMNGLDMMKQIRKRFPLLTLVLYSADPDALARVNADPVKLDQVLQRPFSMNVLHDTLDKIGRQRL